LPSLAASLRDPSIPPDLSDFRALSEAYLKVYNAAFRKHEIDVLIFPQMTAAIPGVLAKSRYLRRIDRHSYETYGADTTQPSAILVSQLRSGQSLIGQRCSFLSRLPQKRELRRYGSDSGFRYSKNVGSIS